jgi:hypothetical protein
MRTEVDRIGTGRHVAVGDDDTHRQVRLFGQASSGRLRVSACTPFNDAVSRYSQADSLGPERIRPGICVQTCERQVSAIHWLPRWYRCGLEGQLVLMVAALREQQRRTPSGVVRPTGSAGDPPLDTGLG